MANTSYPKGAEKILSGAVNLATNTIKAALLPSAYTYSTAHEFLSQLGTRVGTDQELQNKTIANGVFDADDLDFGTLAPGSTIKAVALYKDTGNPSTSPVLLYFDVVTGLPMQTNGGGVTIPWDNGAKKITRLGAPFYPKGAEKVLGGSIKFLTDTLKVALLPAAYVRDDAHEFLADVGATVGAAQTLANKAVTNGVFSADDADFGQLATGSTVGSAVLYVDKGTPAASPLLMHIPDMVGMPLTTNGGGVVVQWSRGAAKIISLVPA